MFDDIGARSQNKSLRRPRSLNQKTIHGPDSSLKLTGFKSTDLMIQVQRRKAWSIHVGLNFLLLKQSDTHKLNRKRNG